MSSSEYDRALGLYATYETAVAVGDANSARDALDELVRMKAGGAGGVDAEPSVPGDGADDHHAFENETQYREAAQSACADAGEREFRLTASQTRVRDTMALGKSKSMLLYHGVGTGKTCAAITVAEHFRGVVFPALGVSGHADRRPVVLVPAHLKSAFVRHLMDVRRLDFGPDGLLRSDFVRQCVGSKYLVAIADRFQMKREEIAVAVHKMINKKFYHIMSHMEFAGVIERMEEKVHRVTSVPERRSTLMAMKLRKMFSDRVLVVDEVHNLRLDNTSDESSKKVPPRLAQVLRSSNNVRLILMTATPMFNDAREVTFLVNLMLMNEKLPLIDTGDVFSADGTITSTGRGVLRRALAGRVSHASGMTPVSFPFRLTPRFNSDPLVCDEYPGKSVSGDELSTRVKADMARMDIVQSDLNGASLVAYSMIHKLLAKSREFEDEEVLVHQGEDGEEVAKSDIHTGRQVCNVVFPTRASPLQDIAASGYGTSGISRCFRAINPRSVRVSMEYAPGVPQFLSRELCGEYAPKIHTIVSRIETCAGKALVYSTYLTTGLVPVAIALEHAGFTRYPDSPFLVGGDRPPLRGHYVMWSGDKTLCCEESHLDVFNSPANTDGSLIKVIICTQRGSEGLDMKALREVHVLEPWYHMNRIEQIVGRAARHCSHANLPVEQRNVGVYLHAASRKKTGHETIDMRIYRIANRKQRVISEVERMLADASSAERGPSSDAMAVRIRQTSAQGVTGHVTVNVDVARRNQRKTEASRGERAVDVDAFIASSVRSGESDSYCVTGVSDACGVSREVAALALEKARASGSLQRIGDKYYAKSRAHRDRTSAMLKADFSVRVGDGTVSAQHDTPSDLFDAHVVRRYHRLLEVMNGCESCLQKRQTELAAIDSVVDGVPSWEVLRAIVAYLLQEDGRDEPLRTSVLDSLRAGGVLFNSYSTAQYLFNPYEREYLRISDDGSTSVTTPEDQQAISDHAHVMRAAAGRVKADGFPHGAIVHTNRQGMEFKVTPSDKSPRGKLATCMQVSKSDLQSMFGALSRRPRGTKRFGCDVVEILLRATDRLFRPVWWLHRSGVKP